jgi:hypothetical protein
MKTIFRSVNMAALLAAIVALGAVTGFAQDACSDTGGINDLDAKVRAANDAVTAATKAATHPDDKSITAGKSFVDLGKQFLEKYGACEAQKDFV